MMTRVIASIVAWARESQASLDGLVHLLGALELERPLSVLERVLEVLDCVLLGQWNAGETPGPACCASPRLDRMEAVERQVNTSLGLARFVWHVVTCRGCGFRWTPLRDALGLVPFQRHSQELEERAIVATTRDSYRRASGCLANDDITVSKSALHLWARQSEADRPPPLPAEAALAGASLAYAPATSRAPDQPPAILRLVVTRDAAGAAGLAGAWGEEAWPLIRRLLAPCALLVLETGPSVADRPERSSPLAEGLAACCEQALACVDERLIRIGCNWSPAGVARMARLLLVRAFHRDHWRAFWDRRQRWPGKRSP